MCPIQVDIIMFTGIIEEIGNLRKIEGMGDEKRLTVACSKVIEGISDGDSVAVNGACLTVASHDRASFTAHVSAETLSCTTLGALKTGDELNLERAMQVGDRFGGHIVQGHVDCIGTIVKFENSGESREMWVEIPEEYISYIASKGSITLDGISLTSVRVEGNQFSVAVIPFTLEQTTLRAKKVGDTLNIEVDIIARYLRRFLEADKSSGGISIHKLAEEGFM